MTEKIKIIFISQNFHFLDNIINSLDINKYEIKKHELKLSTNDLLKPNSRIKCTTELLEVIEDNEIVWVEWLLTTACLLSHVEDKKFKLICRLHSFEYFYKNNIYMRSTNFKNIDKLIIVNDWFKYRIIQNFNVSESKIQIIPILYSEYSNKNLNSRQKNLGVVGINYLTNKGFDKILDIYEKIYKIDSSYKLHIKGDEIKKYSKNPFLSEEESRNLYKLTLEKINIFKEKYPDHIIFHPHTINGGEDMDTFYNSIGFLLCASIYESFHCAIMEAGSSGCIPIIYEYINKDIPKTPEEYSLYKFSNINDIADFIIKIKDYQDKSAKIKKYYEILNKRCLDKYYKLIENIKNNENNSYKIFSIGIILKNDSSKIIDLQNKIIEIVNKNNTILITFFIDKKNYRSNNARFIKCWNKGYLLGNSDFKLPLSIKSIKLFIREPTEEELKNYNIIL
jgi:hypothetical protein